MRLDIALRRHRFLRLGPPDRAADGVRRDRGHAGAWSCASTFQLTVAGRTDAGVHADRAGRARRRPRARSPSPDDPSRAGAQTCTVPAQGRSDQRDRRGPSRLRCAVLRDARHYDYRLTNGGLRGANRSGARRPCRVRSPSISTPCARRRRSCWACTISRRSAAVGKALRRCANYNASTGTATATVFTAYVNADAFCWSMVRSLVGAVLAWGRDAATPLVAQDSSRRNRGRVRSPSPRRTD